MSHYYTDLLKLQKQLEPYHKQLSLLKNNPVIKDFMRVQKQLKPYHKQLSLLKNNPVIKDFMRVQKQLKPYQTQQSLLKNNPVIIKDFMRVQKQLKPYQTQQSLLKSIQVNNNWFDTNVINKLSFPSRVSSKFNFMNDSTFKALNNQLSILSKTNFNLVKKLQPLYYPLNSIADTFKLFSKSYVNNINPFATRIAGEILDEQKNEIEELIDDDYDHEIMIDKLSKIVFDKLLAKINQIGELLSPSEKSFWKITIGDILATLYFIITIILYFHPRENPKTDELLNVSKECPKQIIATRQETNDRFDKLDKKIDLLPQKKNPENSFTIQKPVNLRTKPKSGNKKITILYPDYPVQIINKIIKWYQVKYLDLIDGKNKSGWILKKSHGKKTVRKIN